MVRWKMDQYGERSRSGKTLLKPENGMPLPTVSGRIRRDEHGLMGQVEVKYQ